MAAVRTLPFSAALAVWVALGLLAALYGNWIGLGGHNFAVTLAVLLALLAGQIFFASANLAERTAARLGREAALACALVPVVLYAAYALETQTATLARLSLVTVYALAPALLLFSARGRPPGTWQDYAAAVALWLPVEFRWLFAAWSSAGEFRYVLTTLTAINAGTASFLLIRRLEGIGYTVAWGRRWGWVVLGHFAVFAALAIPFGQAIGFIAFEPHAGRVKLLPVTLTGTLLFTAWPEEFLFRGLLQNLLEKSLRSRLAGLLVGAGVFGLSHINNLGFPNWRYVLLATLAGLFYGRVWQKTGSIFASALVHTLVNTAWGLLFRTR